MSVESGTPLCSTECLLWQFSFPSRDENMIWWFPSGDEATCCRFPWSLYMSEDLRFSRRWLWRMPSSGMWRRVALVRTEVLNNYRLHHQDDKNEWAFLRHVLRLLVSVNVVSSSPIPVTLMMKAILWRVGSNAVVTGQRQVKHFHGYAGLSNSTTRVHGNQEWETSTIGRPVLSIGPARCYKGKTIHNS
jgi:hypothetical protein